MEMPIASPTVFERMKRAALLDIGTYEEVEADTTATTQAAVVVAIVAICSAIGMIAQARTNIPATLVGAFIGAFLGWLVWAGVTYLIGAKILGGTATWGELLRTLGFAQAPGVFLILAVVPLLGWVVRAVVWIWMLVAGVIAIRQALDFSTGRAIGTALLGWLALVIVGAVVGGLAAGWT